MSLWLTVQLMFVAVAIAAVIGIGGAWAASTASESKGRVGRLTAKLFFIAMVVCVATPLILHAAAWEATAGKFGWLPLTQVGSNGYGGLGGVFSGLVAVGWIHGLFGSSLVALATWHGVRRVPAAVIQQCRLERGPVASWWRVRLPLAMPWVATGLLATAALAATEMTVADLYGYRTLADRFYLQYIVDPTPASIARTIAIPLLMAGVILKVVFSYLRMSTTVQSSVAHDVGNESLSGRVTLVATVVAGFIAALVVVVPLFGIVIKAGHEVVVVGTERTASWSISRFAENIFAAPATFAAEYQWSIFLAVLTALVAVVLGWLMAAIGRTNVVFGSAVDWLTIVMVLIPGPIVGVAIVRLFQFDIPGFRFLYHQTLVPTVIGLLLRALPAAYWIVRAGYRGIGDQVIQTARLESSFLVRWWQIDRGLLWRSLGGGFLASVIVASGDVPVMLPVIPPGVTTVGTRLFEQLHSGARYQEASLAFWYVVVITTLAVVFCRASKRTHGRLDANAPR